MAEQWIFTFGVGQEHAGKCVRIDGDYATARHKMCELFGDKWAFQYSAEEWDAWKKDPRRAWMMETEMEIDG